MVDDLLGPALDLGVATLHRVEVQGRGIRAGGHGTRRPATHADAHARAAQLHQQRARGEGLLVRLALGDLAQATGDHDGLVVAAQHAGHRLLEGAEVAREVGPAELVVESRAAQWALDHDVQCAGDVRRLARPAAFPGLVGARQAQVAGGKAREPCLGPRTAAGGTLVADLAARARGRPREGRDGSGVVMGFHLHQHMGGDLPARVGRGRLPGLRQPKPRGASRHHGRVVAVGHHRALGRDRLGVPDHPEHGVRLLDAVDGEAGVEDLVSAVLGVGLGEHHQLHIRGVALQSGEGLDQVVDLVVRQGQAKVTVGLHQRLAALPQHIHLRHGHAGVLVEQGAGGIARARHAFRHPVVQQPRQPGHHIFIQWRRATQQALEQPCGALQPELGDAFHALHRQRAVPRDVGGLAGPGRHGAQAGHHHQQQVCGQRRL